MMKLNIQHTTKKTFVYLVLGLMCLLIINKAIFLHSHVLADGTIITHAHPYSGSDNPHPFKTHHHSKAAFFFYENIDLLFLSVALSFFSFLSIKSTLFFCRHISDYISLYPLQLHERAPPAFC